MTSPLSPISLPSSFLISVSLSIGSLVDAAEAAAAVAAAAAAAAASALAAAVAAAVAAAARHYYGPGVIAVAYPGVVMRCGTLPAHLPRRLASISQLPSPAIYTHLLA